jgi:hypothetical protein
LIGTVGALPVADGEPVSVHGDPCGDNLRFGESLQFGLPAGVAIFEGWQRATGPKAERPPTTGGRPSGGIARRGSRSPAYSGFPPQRLPGSGTRRQSRMP